MNENKKFIVNVCKWFKCNEEQAKIMLEKSRLLYQSENKKTKIENRNNL